MDRLGAWAARAACLALVVAAPVVASAQTPGLLRGHLLDIRTLGPVQSAFVSLQGSPRGVLSDSTGYFALPVAISDSYGLQVKQLGYRDLVHTVSREAADKPLVLQLEADPVELEGLDVLVEQFQDRRRGPYGFVDILDQSDLLRAPDGAASELVRRMVPFARPCTRESEDLCVNTQGRLDPLVICVDDRRVAEGTVELEHLDPRGLYMVEIFPRGGQVRIYTRGYIERLVAVRTELPPLSFGCGLVGLPGPGTAR